ncbi:hypothetical protein CAPTEDRAFT_91463 [Capitella teleta]|uniref:Uncharacterized protein n=1 Tax=Capitella teleta TaxID=283909 RepID=R7UZ77_CAPTE|nr:hypothetical protein CAPTEDRAFT_91463 [Capitella teleta]|eukprot:ELU11878.1 hypothetical protein CAPTEDRAFT_91463 [Capitella teleta]
MPEYTQNPSTIGSNGGTQPLEQQHSMPPQLAATLEHLVAQVDIIQQTVGILEQRLKMTENKLRESLENQQKITLQVRPRDQ